MKFSALQLNDRAIFSRYILSREKADPPLSDLLSVCIIRGKARSLLPRSGDMFILGPGADLYPAFRCTRIFGPTTPNISADISLMYSTTAQNRPIPNGENVSCYGLVCIERPCSQHGGQSCITLSKLCSFKCVFLKTCTVLSTDNDTNFYRGPSLFCFPTGSTARHIPA